MLSNDPKRLRFLGIDMHSRARRRAAVVATYLIYMIVTAGLADQLTSHRRPLMAALGLLSLTIVLAQVGVFGAKGPVKRPEEPRNFYRDLVLLRGLDDWSRYLFGGVYDALTPEEQHTVLMRYKVGGYLLPAGNQHGGFDPDLPDEREMVERNQATTRALTLLTGALFIFAGVTFSDVMYRRTVDDVPALFLTLGFVGATLSKAIILWTEADPREILKQDSAGEPLDS